MPIETQVIFHVLPAISRGEATTTELNPLSEVVGGRVVGMWGPERMGGPMSTRTWPSDCIDGWMRPAKVSIFIATLLPLPPPFLLVEVVSRSDTKRAKQRIPLPHISGSLPSEL